MSISSYDSSDFDEDEKEETEPWKLDPIFRYRDKQHDYFFMDRDDLSGEYSIDDIERYNIRAYTTFITSYICC